MLPDILLRQLKGIIEERMSPTPFSRGEILPISNYGQTTYSPGYMKFRRTLVTNYKVYDPTPFTGQKITGTTSILDNPRLFTWRNKVWDTATDVTPAQLEACESVLDYNLVLEIAKSADEGWNNFLENVAVFGVTGDQIPGLLNGSGIPQAIDLNNFYNGSLNGSQKVDILVDWAGAVPRFTNYRYSTSVLALSPRLMQDLNKTTFAITGSTTSLSALSVLKERLMNLNPEYRIVEAPILEQAKCMAFLPYDPELVGFGVVDLRQWVRLGGEKIEHAGASMGIVAEQPESAIIVRTPNS